jgi:hypothetical protein
MIPLALFLICWLSGASTAWWCFAWFIAGMFVAEKVWAPSWR